MSEDYEKKLMVEIEKFSVISFDIYDTLLKRDVEYSQDIFKCVQKKYNLTHNKNIRRFSEKRKLAARLAYHFSNSSEISIDQIYNYIYYTKNIKNELMALELKYENELIVCNKPFLEIVAYCQSAGKKVYAVSDMYLPQEFIETILENCGYKLDGVYVSSKYGETKVNGKLFDCFLEDTNLQAKDVLHIGDSQIGDIQGSGKVGIQSFEIPTKIKHTHYFDFPSDSKSFELTVMQAFINNRIRADDNRFRQIGYEVLGPFLYGFCVWLHSKAKENNVRKLFFCARDALLTMEIYKMVFGEEALPCEYLFISRKSLLNPYYVSTGEHTDDESKEQYSMLKDYLKKIGFFEPGNIAVVDDGGYCRPQYMLSKCLKSYGAQSKFYSFNFELTRGYRNFLQENTCFAYLYNGKPSPTKMIVSNGLFETLISAVHGSTYRYKRTTDGIEPVFGPSNENGEIITQIQKGAHRFAREWNDTAFCRGSIIPEKIINPFYTFALNPLEKDVELFCNLEKYQDSDAAFILFKGREFYRNHTFAWFSDFQNSIWKGGFLKKNFKRVYLICQVYILLDSIRLFIWKPKVVLGGK